MLKGMLIAGAGGFLGTCLRYLTGRFFQSVAPSGILPWGTFAVNMLGCLLIGVCCGWAERNGWLSPAVHLFLVTGFCGGFTTFSSFSNELYGQWQARAAWPSPFTWQEAWCWDYCACGWGACGAGGCSGLEGLLSYIVIIVFSNDRIVSL